MPSSMLASVLNVQIKTYSFPKLSLKIMFFSSDEMFSFPCIITSHNYSGLMSYDPNFYLQPNLYLVVRNPWRTFCGSVQL